jgi:hypothetical protein
MSRKNHDATSSTDFYLDKSLVINRTQKLCTISGKTPEREQHRIIKYL